MKAKKSKTVGINRELVTRYGVLNDRVSELNKLLFKNSSIGVKINGLKCKLPEINKSIDLIEGIIADLKGEK